MVLVCCSKCIPLTQEYNLAYQIQAALSAQHLGENCVDGVSCWQPRRGRWRCRCVLSPTISSSVQFCGFEISSISTDVPRAKTSLTSSDRKVVPPNTTACFWPQAVISALTCPCLRLPAPRSWLSQPVGSRIETGSVTSTPSQVKASTTA